VERAVAPLRQALRAAARATTRFETAPGQQRQIDFGERRVMIAGVPETLFFFVATLGYSRRCHVRVFPHERQAVWFEGLESAFHHFGGVPETMLLDNAKPLVLDPRRRGLPARFHPRLLAFAQHWGVRPVACAAYRARTKGKDERGVGYVKHNAIAGHAFDSVPAVEAHLIAWTRDVADVRVHGITAVSRHLKLPTPIPRGAMDDRRWGRGVLCTEALVEDDAVVKGDVVEAVLARLAAGETVSAVAAAFDLDRKTVRAWRARATLLAPHAAWLTGLAPEVDFNSEVLARELRTHFGYASTVQTVLRFIRPLRLAAQRPIATVRFETPPGQQAQVDFGQRRVWIRGEPVVAHVFVCTLGYSRRVYVEAFPHERLDAVLAGHEHAFQHFGGVPAQVVVDNATPVVLTHDQDPETRRHRVLWYPTYADFAAHYGFTPWAHWRRPSGPIGPRPRERPSRG
jgi:transposase